MPSNESQQLAHEALIQQAAIQEFRMGMESQEGQYVYILKIEHNDSRTQNRIVHEELRFEEIQLFSFNGSGAQLFQDDGSLGAVFPFDSTRSAITTVPERDENRRLSWFRERLRDFFVYSPDPAKMWALSHQEEDRPTRDLSNFASWLRHVLQDSPELFHVITESLEEVIEGFKGFKPEKVGDTSRLLRVEFRFDSDDAGGGREVQLSFDDLSHGQRSLFALYAVLHAGLRDGATVCFDEPDNFLSLREVQPWLIAVRDKLEDSGGQCLLISHHPEMMNYLAADHGVQFYRNENGAARAKPFELSDNEPLIPSELVARGWE